MGLYPYASISYADGGLVSSGSSSGFSSSNNMAFVSILTEKSSMNNQLLARLIEVLEEKELSVTVVNDDRGATNGGDIRMSREREMSYRGARNIA